jgi:flagellar motor switch protein FliN
MPTDEEVAVMSSPTTTSEAPSADLQEVLAKLAEFLPLTASGAASGPSLDFLQDVPITITARLGQIVMPIGEILKLGPGAVVELDRDISQPVDLTVRGMVFARGEVVVVDGHFAVRIKELVPAKGGKNPLR